MKRILRETRTAGMTHWTWQRFSICLVSLGRSMERRASGTLSWGKLEISSVSNKVRISFFLASERSASDGIAVPISRPRRPLISGMAFLFRMSSSCSVDDAKARATSIADAVPKIIFIVPVAIPSASWESLSRSSRLRTPSSICRHISWTLSGAIFLKTCSAMILNLVFLCHG